MGLDDLFRFRLRSTHGDRSIDGLTELDFLRQGAGRDEAGQDEKPFHGKLLGCVGPSTVPSVSVDRTRDRLLPERTG